LEVTLLNHETVFKFFYSRAEAVEFLFHDGDAVGFLHSRLRHVDEAGGSLGETG